MHKFERLLQIHHVPVYLRFPQTISVSYRLVPIFFIILLNMPLSHGEKNVKKLLTLHIQFIQVTWEKWIKPLFISLYLYRHQIEVIPADKEKKEISFKYCFFLVRCCKIFYHINSGVTLGFPAQKSHNNMREKVSNQKSCVDIANQLLTRHSPLVPLGQVDK